ncbi:hypothetical protein EVB81_240 [Rhizobium phage RHph_I46]|uniref:Uncharacterized protein n=1 Tax=Rhizobium phage RHph_I1_9 TaxID=2509729 RepID=A0A7S5RF15_9CAUD|nr:hypothetical protein PP936_gp238 [Rhizobium phage RHph_I1_9]QIG69809.1 hypothetical protein EVB81_240 [Rhizobium phage RHph_I46]QIG71090.1 hypothetical protein EVB92_240 [Rhizobium phage RHph_I9]QIG73675.1 hypothetical protein EVC04_238 [Rhizobium phage RHph_I1_9]QIG76429.1 hypothetical protein EVC25_240 [Rhizobium phage RHph_I34]
MTDIYGYTVVCDEGQGEIQQEHLRVDFDIAWTDNMIRVEAEPGIWNRFVDSKFYNQFMLDLYDELVFEFVDELNTEATRRKIYDRVQQKVTQYQDLGLLK